MSEKTRQRSYFRKLLFKYVYVYIYMILMVYTHTHTYELVVVQSLSHV